MNWQQELWKQLEKTATEMEEFFNDASKAAESFAEEIGETVDDFIDRVQDVVANEIDSFVRDFIDLIDETEDNFEVSIWENFDELVEEDFMGVGFQRPTADNNPACINCAHYHGRIYDDNLLVCAMHPYGWQDDNCPDWERDKFE
ncbi:hypothetical protein [Myxosarcina sp. GI1]|uniref:hypothetical protein n=1 Tax=Myxosarcina sp. GI1 TaxID=1541065 RepID=UPI00055D9BA2|nr:hypothetical protein [Myxosarcina sp. GI1]